MNTRGWIAGALLMAGITPALAVTDLTPAQIKTTFGSGVPFLATSSNGQSYTFTLKADGTAQQVAKGKTAVTTGTWRVNTTGYCSKWGTSVEHCYTVEKNGDKFDIRDTAGKAVSRWSLLP